MQKTFATHFAILFLLIAAPHENRQIIHFGLFLQFLSRTLLILSTVWFTKHANNSEMTKHNDKSKSIIAA